MQIIEFWSYTLLLLYQSRSSHTFVIIAFALTVSSCSNAVSNKHATQIHVAGVRSATSTKLVDDSTLVFGGIVSQITKADIVRISNNQAAKIAQLHKSRYQHTLTKLANGNILIAGGYEFYGGEGALPSIEEFNPSTLHVGIVAQLNHARGGHQAITLDDGRILFIGGSNGSVQLSTAEIYNPNDQLMQIIPMYESRSHFDIVKLQSGEVLVFGGYGTNMAAIEKFDPTTNSFLRAGYLAYGRFIHKAMLLDSGKVLIAGGFDASDSLSEAEVYDVASETSRLVSPMSIDRDGHTFHKLSDGRVLVLGGADMGIVTSTSEIFDPIAEIFSQGPMLDYAVESHTQNELSTGDLLIYGGTDKVQFFKLKLTPEKIFSRSLIGFGESITNSVID